MILDQVLSLLSPQGKAQMVQSAQTALKIDLIERIRTFEEQDYPVMQRIARVIAQAQGTRLTNFQKRKNKLIELVEMLDGKDIRRLESFMVNLRRNTGNSSV